MYQTWLSWKLSQGRFELLMNISLAQLKLKHYKENIIFCLCAAEMFGDLHLWQEFGWFCETQPWMRCFWRCYANISCKQTLTHNVASFIKLILVWCLHRHKTCNNIFFQSDRMEVDRGEKSGEFVNLCRSRSLEFLVHIKLQTFW